MFFKFFYRSSRIVNANIGSWSSATRFRQFSTVNYYAVLGLVNNASADAIKKAYLRLVQKHHPDHGGTQEAFIRIKNAYDALNEKTENTYQDSFKSNYKPKREYKKSKSTRPYRDDLNRYDFKSITSFDNLEQLLVQQFDKSSYIRVLSAIGQEKLCSLLKDNFDLALLIINIPENDREELVNLIGREHIGRVLKLPELLRRDMTCYKVRTNSETIFNKFTLSWEEYKEIFKILGRDTIMVCLEERYSNGTLSPYGFQYGFLLGSIRFLFGTTACDEFIDYLGDRIFTVNHHILNQSIESISENKQKDLLNSFKPGYFQSEYRFLFEVTKTLTLLYPNNHQLFLNLIGKDHLNSLMNHDMDAQHREDFKNIVKTLLPESEEDSPQFRC